MFQFSNLLTRQGSGASRGRPSDASPVRTRDQDSVAIPTPQCVSERARRDLDVQMQRLAELLDRVESLEFEREAATADIFGFSQSDLAEESAGQLRIFDESAGSPVADAVIAFPNATCVGRVESCANEVAECDEPLPSRVVPTPIEMPAQIDEAAPPSAPCRKTSTLVARQPVRRAIPLGTPISSGIVQDYRSTPTRGMPRSPSVYETCEPSGTNAAQMNASVNPTSSLGPVAGDFLDSEDSAIDAMDSNVELRPTGGDEPIEPFPNSCHLESPAAEGLPWVATPSDLWSHAIAASGVHMLVVNNNPICPISPPIHTALELHGYSFAQSVNVKLMEPDASIAFEVRSIPRIGSITRTTSSDDASNSRSISGSSQTWNMLAVIGALLILAALAHVAIDLESLFGSVR